MLRGALTLDSNSLEFKALQKKWAKKLRASGFIDIEEEDGRHLKFCHATYFRSNYDPLSFANKEEYFRRAGKFFHQHSFQDIFEMEVWRLHKDGSSVREIANTLSYPAFKCSKDRVMRTLQKLQKMMEKTFLEDEDLPYDE